MDQQEKDLHKNKERERDKKEEKEEEKIRGQKEAKGARIIRPFWLGVVGFVLAMSALLCWIFFL